ncbi:MAG: beta-propeller domain-containing protein [Acidimicrobiia bacterium]|nr:beta-propeller domain-containing protein [Acidimicrobiia bacterium]
MGITARTDIRRTAVPMLGFVALAGAVTVASLVATPPGPAGAEELVRFDSCAEISEWTASSGTDLSLGQQHDRATADSANAPLPATAGEAATVIADSDAGSGQSGTNTVVQGVDEIDVADRVGDDRLVVARNGALALVNLRSRTVIAELLGIPGDARVSVDGDIVWVVGSRTDGGGTTVRRVTIAGDDLLDGEEWSTPGYVLDARRTGDALHLVAVDHPGQFGGIPFDGGPVPCHEVWRPVEPVTDLSATLVVTLPARGPLQPTAAAEIVGAGSNILVTAQAVYVATTTWGTDSISTGLHRFDLATLAPTGSGSVPGALAGPFALDERDGHLRVATNLSAAIGVPVPLGVESDGDRAVASDVVTDTAMIEAPDELAEVFVLDTENDLDVVGRTGRFGHPGETIRGVRFVGDTAYVVTFLTTDPFWVIDLSDPAAPAITGELEVPGFSAYLHPVDDDTVVGFGPDGSGKVAARLFDVTDPTAPAVVDELVLGDDSPVVWDHHAYVTLDDGRFAVPVNDWPAATQERCVTFSPAPGDEPSSSGGGSAGGSAPSTGAASPVCAPDMSGGRMGVAVLGVAGDSFDTVDRQVVESDGSTSAERAVLTPDGAWLLLVWDRLVATDGGSSIPLPGDPSMTGTEYITD